MSNEPTLTPRLIVRNAQSAIEFYCAVLGAKVLEQYEFEGAVVHASLQVNGAIFALAEENMAWKNHSPLSLEGSGVILQLRCQDPDGLAQRVVDAGGEVVFPVADQSYGVREGRVQDPFGHLWMIGKKIADLSPDEIQGRMDAIGD